MSEPTPAKALEDDAPQPEQDDAFELLWAKVQEHWDDDKMHAAFLEYARARFQLPEAGARYRAIKEGDPARADVAQQKLQQLMVLALSMLEAARDETPSSAPRWVSSIAFAVAAVFLAVLIRKVFAGP